MPVHPEVPVAALAALVTHVIEHDDLDDALRRVCEVTIDVVGGAEEASVSLLRDGTPKTLGATGDLAIAADDKQYQAGSGPCLEAARSNLLVSVPDLRSDDRWPAAAPQMAKLGARSSLSLPLRIQGEAIAALNLYARTERAFGATSQAIGEQFATYAAVAVANAVSYSTAADAARGLREAMEHRAAIEQAKGILIATTGCDADEAFRLLVLQSQHENRKLREIAIELVERSIRST